MDLAALSGKYFVLIQSAKEGVDDKIVVIDQISGAVKDTLKIGQSGVCAITAEGGTLWVLSRSGGKFLRNFSASGELLKTYPIKKLPPGKIYGLALTETKLYLSGLGKENAALFEMDRTTFEWREILSLDGWISALAVKDKKLWGAFEDRSGKPTVKKIFSLDPVAPAQIKIRNSLPSTFMGLDADASGFYGLVQTGTGCRIEPFVFWTNPDLILSGPKTREVTYGETYSESTGNAYRLQYVTAVPTDKVFQKISKLKWNVEPKEIAVDRFGNAWAKFDFDNRRGPVEITASFQITTWNVKYLVDPAMNFDASQVPAGLLQEHTKATYCFDYSDPDLSAAVKAIPSSKTWWEKILAARDLANDALVVKGPTGPQSQASYFFKNGVGRCYAHTLLFGAAARASGLPIRAIGGVNIAQDEDKDFPADEDLSVHTWNQVFIPGMGWVDFDSQLDDNPAGRPHAVNRAAYHTGDYWITFNGDYDKYNGKDVFTQRAWISSMHWSSVKEKADLRQSATRIRVKTIQ
ncbi:MAG: transglutaminase family protein, partial [Spirochaetia bacterium]|nr:transglutaminase family protein [Spirochaetia bacterium]